MGSASHALHQFDEALEFHQAQLKDIRFGAGGGSLDHSAAAAAHRGCARALQAMNLFEAATQHSQLEQEELSLAQTGTSETDSGGRGLRDLEASTPGVAPLRMRSPVARLREARVYVANQVGSGGG
jgi:hypothetical protein